MYYCIKNLVQQYNNTGGERMAWKLDSGRPIYAQLVERVELAIIAGCYKAGDKLPSVREMAVEAGSQSEHDAKGNVRTGEKRSCSFRTDQREIHNRGWAYDRKMRKIWQQHRSRSLWKKMNQMGFKKEEILELIQKTLEEGKNEYNFRNAGGCQNGMARNWRWIM